MAISLPLFNNVIHDGDLPISNFQLLSKNTLSTKTGFLFPVLFSPYIVIPYSNSTVDSSGTITFCIKKRHTTKKNVYYCFFFSMFQKPSKKFSKIVDCTTKNTANKANHNTENAECIFYYYMCANSFMLCVVKTSKQKHTSLRSASTLRFKNFWKLVSRKEIGKFPHC